MVSATPLQEFMSNSDMTITMTQDSTTDVFSMNTAGLSFDNQVISSSNLEGNSVSFPISKLLNGINLRADLNNGATSPVFSNVAISTDTSNGILINGASYSLVQLLDLISMTQKLGITFTGNTTSDTQLLNTLASQNPSQVPMQGNAYFVKDGTTYTFGYSKGFGAIPNEYKNQIGEAITNGINSMNIQNVIEQKLLPSVSFSDYLPVLQSLGYSVSQENINFANSILKNTDYSNANYNIGVDLTTLAFQDGTYTIPITINGNGETITKTITLVLKGIVNEKQATTDGTYTPSDAGSSTSVIKSIQGLQPNTLVTIQVSDTKPAEVNTLSHTNGLKYLIIDTQGVQPTSGAQISFSIDKSEVSNRDKVSLYVWEPTSSSWTKLIPTTYTGETATEYEYTATTPHFSTFMIGEDTTPSSSSSSGGGSTGEVYSSQIPTTTNTNNAVTTPLSTTNPTDTSATGTSSPITGGVIGFIKSGAGIVTILVLMITVLLTMVVFSLKKRK